jgi:hypothetical protein
MNFTEGILWSVFLLDWVKVNLSLEVTIEAYMVERHQGSNIFTCQVCFNILTPSSGWKQTAS